MKITNEKAYLDAFDTIRLVVDHELKVTPYLLDQATNEQMKLYIKDKILTKEGINYILLIQGFISCSTAYDVVIDEAIKTPLLIGKITQTKWFDQQFYAPNAKLGMFYEKAKTTFRIWSPTAAEVSVLLYGEKVEKYGLKKGLSGIWEVEILGDLDGSRYKYLIKNDHVERETTDPYGIASTENGTYSVVVDLEKTPKVTQLSPQLKQPTDAIIYEVNVRDFTIHASSPTTHKGQYLGLAEIDHLKDLGVTHIQLLPIYDFEGIDELEPTKSYNWGYNPSQYNVPEGSYSSNPKDPYARINELKTLINNLHEKGLYVIMDVVYNHVYETKTHPFNAFVPKYYYRYDEEGNQIEGSGCGSDVASERSMVRKYIVDSVTYWLTEYGIDGFRFDLMGLHDVATMKEVRKACDAIDPNLLLYGEGWHIPTGIPSEDQASMVNAHKMRRISHFNDYFRNTIKGSNFDDNELGLASGNPDFIAAGKEILAGKMPKFHDPAQSINYVECHDDHTLWDRLKINNPDESEENLQKRHLLATAMTIFAQGIPFLHGGQDFFRTKNGIKNSYRDSDEINAINWDVVKKHQWAIELIKGYLEIRKSHAAFRFTTSVKVEKHLKIVDHEKSVIEYRLENVEKYGPYTEIRIYFNLKKKPLTLTDDFQSFSVIANAGKSGTTPLTNLAEKLFLAPLTTTIIVK